MNWRPRGGMVWRVKKEPTLGHQNEIDKNLERRILVVDDESSLRTLLAELLRKEGYLTETASDGLEALNKVVKAKDGLYAAIVMDWRMPRMDGEEATKRMRERNTKVPIVICSLKYEKDPGVKKFGADRYFYKGRPLGELVEMIEQLVK